MQKTLTQGSWFTAVALLVIAAAAGSAPLAAAAVVAGQAGACLTYQRIRRVWVRQTYEIALEQGIRLEREDPERAARLVPVTRAESSS